MSYIGKNPKVDSVKLEGSATAASGTEEGQLYYNTGTGSISKGLKVFKNSQFVSIDKQLGDADTFHLLKAADISTAEFSAARNSTSTSFLNQNSVPFETTTASGVAGTFSNSSTGDALLTDESADLVFAYKSSGTSDDAQEYFGIPLTVPKAFRGGNVVLTFEYRTGFGTGTTATVDGDFEVAVLDKSTGNGGQTTSTNSTTDITAGSAITVASKTGLAVGQRIRLEAGSQSSIGHPDATVVEAFITSVSSTANEITISENWDTPHASGAVVVSGWLTDIVPGRLLAADSQTDKQGKKYSIQFKTEDDTSDIVLFFQNKNTSSTISRHLFVDNILLSANKFLQASSQGKSEAYFAKKQSNFWDNSTGNGYLFDESLLLPKGDSPPLAQSKLITVADGLLSDGTTSGSVITAKEDIVLSLAATAALSAGSGLHLYYINDDEIASHSQPDGSTAINQVDVSATVNAKKGDKFFFLHQAGNRNGGLYITAEPQTSSVVILESQDEIFEDWTEFTPTIGGSTVSDVKFHYRRTGSNMDIRGTYLINTIGTGTDAAPGSFTLPTGFKLDTTQLVSQKSVLGRGFYIDSGGFYITENARGWVMTYYAGGTSPAGDSAVYFAARASTSSQLEIDNLSGILGDNNRQFSIFCSVPVQGYNVNFNPLLSLPLVEIGANTETFWGYDTSAASSKSYRAKLDNINVNTISNLGTIDNNSTNGWSFQANQRVKVHLNFGLASGAGITGLGAVKYDSTLGSPSTTTNNGIDNSYWDGYRIASVQDTVGSGYQGATGASFIMEAGEYIQLIQERTDFQNSNKSVVTLMVEKDFSNTNMAHIIKPAVCEFSMQLSSNTSGGDSTAGAWNQLKPNTFKGETWFLSGFNGTLGVGGTNTDFDLDPGTYSLECTTQVYSAGTAMLKLISGTTVFAYGQTQYTNSTTGDAANASLFTTFTINAKTTFTIKMNTSASQAPNGLGHAAGISGVPETYLAGFIHKLK